MKGPKRKEGQRQMKPVVKKTNKIWIRKVDGKSYSQVVEGKRNGDEDDDGYGPCET